MSENSTLPAVEPRVFSTSEIIRKLRILSKNLWWSWNLEAQEIFEALSPRLWSKYNHNPAEVMMNVSEQEISARLGDAVFYEHVRAVLQRFEDYLSETDTWASRHAPEFTEHPIAYFSAEFGLHESLPIYSGGLGVLAGDHIKAASDLGLKLRWYQPVLPRGLFSTAALTRWMATGKLSALSPRILTDGTRVR